MSVQVPANSAYFTRSQVLTSYKAAGVLPIALHEDRIVALLGCEPRAWGKTRRQFWSDFGGQREALDADSAATAAREFAEETLGMFGTYAVDQSSVQLSAESVAARLRGGDGVVRIVSALKKGSSYEMFVLRTSFVSPFFLRLATQQNATTGAVANAEKVAFAWVPLGELLCAAAAGSGVLSTAGGLVCGGVGTPWAGQQGMRRFVLQPCFANTLRNVSTLAEFGDLVRSCAVGAPSVLPATPAAGQRKGGGAVAAPAAALADSGASTSTEPDPRGVGYWLAQDGIAAQLRTPDAAEGAWERIEASPGASTSAAAEVEEVLRARQLAGVPARKGPTRKQRQRDRRRQLKLAAASEDVEAGVPAAEPALADAAGGKQGQERTLQLAARPRGGFQPRLSPNKKRVRVALAL